MRRLAILVSLLAACASTPAPAQPGPPPLTGVTYVHAGRLLDRPGRPPRGPSTLIIAGGRIIEVRDGLTPAPAGATFVDLADRYVLPGLIDSHVHLDSDAGGIASLVEDVTGSVPATTLRTLANARKTIEAGFT